MKENKENISTIFLLPAVEIPESIKDEFYRFGFKNTYITSNILKYPYEVIFIVFQPDRFDTEYSKFEKELTKNRNFIEEYDLGNNTVVYVFRVPKKYQRDYYLFIEGKYSELSGSYKNLFPKKTYIYDSGGRKLKDKQGKYILEPSPFYHVFDRTEYLKSKWADKIGYDINDPIFDNLELYDIQIPEKEQIEILINI